MTKSDAKRVVKMHKEQHGVDGMVSSLDVMHIPWRNCPMEEKGQHEGKDGAPTLALEAASDYNLWIWHHFFGTPGACNDINIWERSPLLQSFIDGSFAELDFQYFIDGQLFTMLYFLVDGIYPQLARFVQTILVPLTKMDRSCRYKLALTF